MSHHGADQSVGPTDAELLSIGKLHFLASFCPLHQRMPEAALARIFYPALNNGCVRFFENEQGRTAAALIWARLSDEVAGRMTRDGRLPTQGEWTGGSRLWFLDLLAPFGHGRIVARSIARNPPPEPFWFARLDDSGALRKVVRGDATAPAGRRVLARMGGGL
ncbi:toxin-activating lysine-acyltransferase [Thiosulfatihalobacter marinus]|jgi:cytolysin-activating lysine-acyltransferase|uniref:toxin-activating lysine-acyltransferase n=1 Tax=Thiosulfatihalobacter marinus TaxID=2792481 RepID=UPI0018D6A1E0|nr:toxin-activating lysine-acyltransferase [Thiosulfatihalobacter marinus]